MSQETAELLSMFLFSGISGVLILAPATDHLQNHWENSPKYLLILLAAIGVAGAFSLIANSMENYQYVADSYFYLGEAKYYLEKYNEAIEDYNTFLKSPVRDVNLSNKAEFMICKSWFHLSNDVMKDQTDTKIAIDKLQSYIEKVFIMYLE